MSAHFPPGKYFGPLFISRGEDWLAEVGAACTVLEKEFLVYTNLPQRKDGHDKGTCPQKSQLSPVS